MSKHTGSQAVSCPQCRHRFTESTDKENATCTKCYTEFSNPGYSDVNTQRPLRDLILGARLMGMNIWSRYQDIVFTPDQLDAQLADGKFCWWHMGNWEATNRPQNREGVVSPLMALQADNATLNKRVAVLERALGMVCGRLWIKTPEGTSWTYLYDKYLKYAEMEIAGEQEATGAAAKNIKDLTDEKNESI